MKSKSIKTNTIYNMVKTFANVIFPLITFPYVSRVLMPEGVGIYNFSSSYVGYFALLASLGVTTYAIRECAQVKHNKEQLSVVASQIFSINICTTLISYVLLFITLIFFRPLDDYREVIIIYSTTIFFTTCGADWLNSALEDFKYITIRTVVFQIVSLLLVFLFVKESNDYVIYAIIMTLSSSGANLVNVFYRRKLCKIKFVIEMEWKKHFSGIFLLFVMQLSQIIFCNADVTMLGLMRTDAEVGLYSTAVRIYNIVNQVLASIVWVVMPKLSIYFAEKNYLEINKLLRSIFGFLIGLGLPCLVGIWMLSEEIVEIIGGVAYLEAAPALQILMIAEFFSLVGGSFIGNIILLPSKKEKYYMYACCTTAVVNVILNYLFIPKYGITAAACSTAVTAAIIFVMLVPYIDQEIKFTNIRKFIVAPVIGCIVIIAYILIIKFLGLSLWLRLLVSVMGSVCAYAIVMIVCKHELVMNALESVGRKFFK